MDNKFLIRTANENDVPAIFALIKELAEFEKLADQINTTENELRKTLFGEDRFVEILLAEFNGEIVGQALFFKNFSTFLGKPGIYLEDLYVKPEMRGKGIGKMLLDKIISIAKERNYGRVEWSVLDWNESAIDFYKKIGAKPLDDWTIFRLTSDKF
ncbi:MAG: GNAT family N-acetyltransferase [Ignavibacteriales bacterium]|nr:GNAT family N-acetyltransferase [Ignavibacteriales bacterium]MBP9119857.1 GNAT family N-acetyltransferase [Ignavibacterium sp.]